MMTAVWKEVIVLFNSVYLGPDLDILLYPPFPSPGTYISPLAKMQPKMFYV